MFVCWIIIVAVIIAGVVLIVTAIIPQGSSQATPVTMDVPSDIAAAIPVLRQRGVLRFPRTFRVVMAIQRRSIHPGKYTVSPHLSAWSLARLLTTTAPRTERTVQIIEGWNLRDIGQYLEREGIAQAKEFHELVGFPAMDYRSADLAIPRPKDFATDFTFLRDNGRPDFVGLEGYLFPDTYRVYMDATIEDIVRKMLENFDRKLTLELREEIVKSGRSLHQIITMASIVEAEISNHDDRAVAAGILWKRRDRGMLLQVDATVNYVTGKHDPRVSRVDT
ncbi:MAG: endolytic transglycosylase MltG, partial [bacterium]|nr:endolytic transglycosylase MltG [bacterium]